MFVSRAISHGHSRSHFRAGIETIAEHQSRLLSRLQTQNDDFVLCTNDHLILKRGRNAASSRNHNHRKDPVVYQDSTAFEALLGYLYIASPDRFTSLLHWMDRNIDCA